ncbi:MAG: helix-hairpin-helix domain-containing protein [Planctomycetota bacterium]
MKKATHKSDRNSVTDFRQIVNIGPSISDDFIRIGIKSPTGLIGQDPLKLYRKICRTDGRFHDPCVLDCFMSAIDFMNGNRPRKWWDFTDTRKKKYSGAVDSLRNTYPR